MKIAKLKIENLSGGYTIIETMIAVSLFLVIIMTGMGALLNANLLHQKSRDMRSIMDNLSFIMEDMSRNLRTGYNYYCITGADTLSSVSATESGSSCWGIAFESSATPANQVADPNNQWVYYIGNDKKIYKSTQGPYVASSFMPLTPDEVEIDTTASNFSVLGAEPYLGNCVSPSDCQQPFVTIRLVGTITYKPGTSNSVVTPFSLQTSVSQRLIDI